MKKDNKPTQTLGETDYPGQWWSCPAESENGDEIIFVTGRIDVERFRTNPKYSIRVEVTMPYPSATGMPDEATGQTLRDVTDRLVEAFRKDPVAVLTGIYTGAGERNWVFYTVSTNIFGRKLNEALADLPVLPITISAENDNGWDEYTEMRSLLDSVPHD